LELFVGQQKARLAAEWDVVANREKRTRTVFAQHAMRPEEVAAELQAAVAAIGSEDDVRRFVEEAAQRLGAPPASTSDGRVLTIDVRRLPSAVRGRAGVEGDGLLRVGFDAAVPAGVAYLERTHPLVEALGTYLLDTALDEPSSAIAKRAGAIRTRAVSERTVLLLARGRYLVRENRPGELRELLAEEALLLGLRGDLRSPTWLAGDEVERLALKAEPAANVSPQQAALWMRQVEEAFGDLARELNRIANDRATELLAAHHRVRRAARLTGVRQSVEAKTPIDLIGAYVLMPLPATVR
jgi:hypothetical protein